MFTSATLMVLFLIVLTTTFIIGLIQHPTCRAIAGFGQILFVPAILVVAYLGNMPWLAGYFTAVAVGLLARLITAANQELARKQ